jgi:microcystin-dependent protein
MSQPYLGQIAVFGFNFNPRGYALCNGQLLPINQNQALFSLLGTTYGGNGIQTFALPNLQSRVAVGAGQGPGLSSYSLGQVGGEENHTLLQSEMPQHVHALQASNVAGATPSPSGASLAQPSTKMYSTATSLTALAPASIATAGGSQPHSNIQPYLIINFCIALQGIFPSRN